MGADRVDLHDVQYVLHGCPMSAHKKTLFLVRQSLVGLFIIECTECEWFNDYVRDDRRAEHTFSVTQEDALHRSRIHAGWRHRTSARFIQGVLR